MIIGIAGGSGSGKTYFATALQMRLGLERCAIVYQDSFYVDQSSKFDYDGGTVNFDHPDSIDFQLLSERLRELKGARTARIPVYDFVTHARSAQCETVEPKPVILVDGTLIFHSDLVRPLFDELIFFATPEDLRFQRRFQRDINERGRSPDGVRRQFYSQVKPMHDLYVEPSKAHATSIILDKGQFDDVLDGYARKLALK